MDRSSPHASVQYIVRVTKTLYGEVPRNRSGKQIQDDDHLIVEMTMEICTKRELL